MFGYPFQFGFAFRSLFFSADDVFPSFVYDIRILEAAALDTLKEVRILVADAPGKGGQTICTL